MAIFLIAWTSTVGFIAAFFTGLFIVRPDRERARLALGFTAVAIVMFLITAFWLHA